VQLANLLCKGNYAVSGDIDAVKKVTPGDDIKFLHTFLFDFVKFHHLHATSTPPPSHLDPVSKGMGMGRSSVTSRRRRFGSSGIR
jgi:hypothetical protein